jgi:hypothetical protein
MSNLNVFANQRNSFYSKNSEIGFFGLRPKDTNDNVKKSTISSFVN